MFRIVLALFLGLVAAPAFATEAGWALMRNGGQVVLMHHAHAPGSGEPARFDIAQCATQRNLSDRGRQQARRIGALVAARAAPIEQVLTSRFCRCIDTATMAFGAGMVETFEALDFFADDAEAQPARNAEIVARALDYTGSGNLIMVTHPEVIEALVGARSRAGEMIILDRRTDELGIAGRIAF